MIAPSDMSGAVPEGRDNPVEGGTGARLGALVDLPVLAAAVRRRRRLIVLAACSGLALGAGLHVVVPRKYAATSVVYLVQPPDADPNQAMATDLNLLATTAVAQQAMKQLHLDTGGSNVQHFLASASAVALANGTTVSTQALSVTFTASSPSAAIARDDAVADAFLAVRAQLYTEQTQTLVSGLQGAAASESENIAALSKQIQALSTAPAGPGTATQLASLVNDRGGATTQLTQLQAQIQQEQLDVADVTGGSRILDAATVTSSSTKKVVATDGLSGLVAGLGLSLGGVAVAAAVSDRPRRREDVAAALGAPVELSVPGIGVDPRPSSRRLRRALRRPTPELAMVTRRLRARLEVAPDSALAVVAVGGPALGALAAAALAERLAAEGKRIVVVDAAEGRPVASAFGRHLAEGVPSEVRIGPSAVVVIPGPSDPALLSVKAIPEGVDVVLVLATIDPAVGADHLGSWAVDAVAVVSAGRASQLQLVTTSRLVRHAGLSLRSGILIGADAGDHSIGTAPDAGLGRAASDWLPNDG